MLFLTNKLDYIILYYIILDYITQINNEIIKSFCAYAVLLLLQDNITLRGRRHLPNR